MAMKLIAALALVAVASAAPFTDISSVQFCPSWSPFGTEYAADESPYDYFCSGSQDGRSVTLRVIAPESDDAFSYLMMTAVDMSGNAMIEGTYKLDSRLRSVTCDDKAKRVVKVSEEKINDIIVTYHLPEDKEVTLEQIHCRFAVAQSLDTYYRDVTYDRFGKIVTEFAETSAPVATETDAPVETETEVVVEPEEVVEVETNDNTTEPEVAIEPEVFIEPEVVVDDNTTLIESNVTVNEQPSIESNETAPVEVPVEETITTTTEATVDTGDFDAVDEFQVTNTIDETEELMNQFETEETIGKEIHTDSKQNVTLSIGTPESVPETTDEQKNEGETVEEEEQEFMIDEFGIKRVIIPEKEKKLSYKGTLTGYWCEDMGNTYVMAPGTDCQMFYQTIMRDEHASEVVPLAHFNCAPGTRFNTFKCTCSSFGGMVCPDPNPGFQTTTLRPPTVQVSSGGDNSTAVDTSIEPSLTNGTQF